MMYTLWMQLRIFVDYMIDFFFGCYFKSQKNCLPPISSELVLESACSLARKVRTRKVKAEEVVGAFIERTKQVNPFINALVEDRFLEALREARKIDEDIRNDRITEEDFRNKPFLGVPFTAKESIACKGLKWTLGLLVRKNVLAEEDAKVVQLMKEAGAINIGVTNVPQLNFWPESYNPVYGMTKNPYDLARNAGGSSGGEGSLIAACGSPLGIGTDLGGSVRIPAHRCGIFAHKSTQNLIPTKGLSFSKGDVPTLNVVGPMVKHAEDLVPMYKILLGTSVSELKLDEHVDLGKLNVFYMTSINCIWCSPVQKEIKKNVIKVVEHFEKISEKKAISVDFEDMKYAMQLWSYKIRLENSDFKANLTNRQGRVNVPLEYLKYIFGKSEYTLYTLYNMIDALLPSVDFEWAKETLSQLRTSILTTLGDDGVLILPSEPQPADYHYSTILRRGLSYFCLWNALEMPVTQVPLGLDSSGLPIGVQIVTAPYQDHLSIAVANELEHAFGGHVTPGSLDL